MEMWIGADWDKEKCILSYEEDGKMNRGRVLRNPASVRELVGRWPSASVMVGVECGDPTWSTLWRQAGAEVFVFNGMKVKRFCESLTASGASDDHRSAFALREMVKSDVHRAAANVAVSSDARALTQLLESYEAASSDAVKYGNRVMSLLRNVMPAFAALLNRGVDAQWSLRLLQAAPTPRAWKALRASRREKLFKSVPGKRRVAYAAALGDDYELVSEVEEPVQRVRIRAAVKMFQAAREVRDEVRARLDEWTTQDPKTVAIRAICGVGPVVAAAIAVALDVWTEHESKDRDRGAKRLAVAPVTKRSGVRGDQAPLVVMRRASGTLMRKLGHIIGLQLVRHAAWAKAQHAYNRSRGQRAFASYRRISRSFLRIMVAMLRDNTQFDEEQYIKALKEKKVEWAMAL